MALQAFEKIRTGQFFGGAGSKSVTEINHDLRSNVLQQAAKTLQREKNTDPARIKFLKRFAPV